MSFCFWFGSFWSITLERQLLSIVTPAFWPHSSRLVSVNLDILTDNGLCRNDLQCPDNFLANLAHDIPALRTQQILPNQTVLYLFGGHTFRNEDAKMDDSISLIMENGSDVERKYAEQIPKTFLIAMEHKKDSP